MSQNLKYPIGKFVFDEKLTTSNLEDLILEIKNFPKNLNELIINISEEEYTKTYRPDGWTIRQLVHHLSDSHSNMYIRVKSALAEDKAQIMGYDEATWATFKDNELPLSISISMVASIHAKLAHIFTNLTQDEWQMSYLHSGDKRLYKLLEVLGLYVWHGNHHLEHIKIASAS